MTGEFQPDLGVFGEYELLEEIGRGGMGVVYRARQRRLDRVVALKMLAASRWASTEQTRRFEAEAQAAARVSHPNLVKVFDVGENQGIHYFVMERVAGESLARKIEKGRLGLDEAARIISQVARAVDCLHRHGVIHRDLKPSNILLDREGQPFVTDFGLAKIRGSEELTQTDAVIGTPAYMSPEQAAGRHEEVDARSDVYSLGAILYELLTGTAPASGVSPMEALAQIIEREPVPPRQRNPHLPRDIELICLKCMEKRRENRYPTAAALASDCERYLRGELVEARSAGPVQRLQRWARHEPAVASRLGGIALFYGVQLLNYHAFALIDLGLHLRLSAILLVWALACVAFQRLLYRERWAKLAMLAWGIADILSLTAILLCLNGAVSALVVVYPLLIVGSSLWCYERFVWLSTAGSMTSYVILMLDLRFWRPERYVGVFEITYDRHVFFLLMLLVTGTLLAYQVRRLRALSRYCGRRPSG